MECSTAVTQYTIKPFMAGKLNQAIAECLSALPVMSRSTHERAYGTFTIPKM
jgi:hypothetical protein